MNCPICNVALLMSEKKGIEIDYCPTCRGVWLDRGELEKIIERSYSPENRSEQIFHDEHQFDTRKNGFEEHDSNQNRNGRKRNFFSDLFD
jgi:Zn-finger nucleic acid-binding protein